jgi:acetyl-CoA carboxylase biotin carboxyl carrier protein
MEMSPETIKALLDAFDGSDWKEMIVTVGDDRLHVSRDPLPEGATLAAPPAAPAPSAPPAAASAGSAGGGADAGAPRGAQAAPPPSTVGEASAPGPAVDPAHSAIESPSVGLFWRSPSPGAPPFVEVGAKVAAGDTVAIVEVMKLMNHVASPVDGVVSAILIENGAPVEFGQVIVTIDPQS